MVKFKVEPEAQEDLLEITGYLVEVAMNRRAASAVVDEFERKCASYARQPLMGDVRDDLGEGYRSFTFRRWYVALYLPFEDGIRVLRIFDGRRDYGRHFTL